MRTCLTEMSKTVTMLLAGETDAGSAEVQPARDSQTRATYGRRDDGIMPVIPFFQIPFGAFLCLLKTSLPKARLRANRKGVCPFHAEPVQ
jgi:hypothetical protein